MPKHHGHHHHPCEHGPSPAGLHRIAGRLQEMRAMGAKNEDIEAVLALLKDKLPKSLIATVDALNLSDQGTAMAQCAEGANTVALESLRTKKGLIAGEMKPHLIEELMREGISLFQVHDATHHGDRPPHFRHLANRYANQFTGVLSLLEIRDQQFDDFSWFSRATVML